MIKNLATSPKYEREKKMSITNLDPETLYTQKNTGLSQTVRVWPTDELAQLSPVSSVKIDDIVMGG